MYVTRIIMWVSKCMGGGGAGHKLLPTFVCFVYRLLKKTEASMLVTIFSSSILEAAACLQ